MVKLDKKTKKRIRRTILEDLQKQQAYYQKFAKRHTKKTLTTVPKSKEPSQ